MPPRSVHFHMHRQQPLILLPTSTYTHTPSFSPRTKPIFSAAHLIHWPPTCLENNQADISLLLPYITSLLLPAHSILLHALPFVSTGRNSIVLPLISDLPFNGHPLIKFRASRLTISYLSSKYRHLVKVDFQNTSSGELDHSCLGRVPTNTSAALGKKAIGD